MRVRFQADADLNLVVLLAVVPQHLSIPAAVEDLLLIWAASEAEEWTNRACYLPL